jgi:hypothetical protein
MLATTSAAIRVNFPSRRWNKVQYAAFTQDVGAVK